MTNAEKTGKKLKDKSCFIELPCKIGDTVYFNEHKNGKFVKRHMFNISDVAYICKSIERDKITYNVIPIGCFDKWVFKTEEDADKAISEMENQVIIKQQSITAAQEYCTNYLKSLIGNNSYIVLSKDELKKHCAVICERFESDLKSPKKIIALVDKNFKLGRKTDNEVILYYGTEDPRIRKKHMNKR